ncbi:MAG: hypothetical protein ABR555_12095 [Pyrinomonadaceae bacterium]
MWQEQGYAVEAEEKNLNLVGATMDSLDPANGAHSVKSQMDI